MTKRFKQTLMTVAVLLGLALIVGATANLPTSAQGLVTGRSEILIDQLADRVGEQALAAAVIDSGEIRLRQRPEPNQEGARGNRSGNRRPRRARGRPRINGDLEDQLERLGPERVYLIAVEADLITQVEATRILNQ